MNTKQTIGDRIRLARSDMMLSRGRKKLSQRAIAAHLNITPASVAEWELGGTRPSREKMRPLASLLDVSLLWLEFGLGLPDQKENVNFTSTSEGVGGKRVPIVDVPLAAESVSDAITASRESIISHYATSDNCIAFVVWNEANRSPDGRGGYNVGDRVVLDLDATPRPGDMVLASTVTGPAFGHLFVSADGGTLETLTINHINPAYGRVAIVDRSCIIGVAIEHTQPLRR